MVRRLVLASLFATLPSLALAGEPACPHGCAQAQPASTAREQISLDGAATRGPADAKVTVVVFSDFECPYCARGAGTIRALEQKYGRQVRFVFKQRPLPMHPHAALAAEAALAANAQGRFWEFHDRLFSRQGTLDRAGLEQAALDAGLRLSDFRAALDGRTYAEQVRRDGLEAERLDVRGTPTFFVNGVRLVGAQPLEAFTEVIDRELARG